jgi:hypothetical protein
MTTWRILDGPPNDSVEQYRFGCEDTAIGVGAGMLVEFGPGPSSRWVGEFATGGWTGHRSLGPFPDGRRVVVLAEGNAYLIDPDSRRLDQHFS